MQSGMESLVGQVVDNYRILEILGRGGMGIVFKAIDLNLDKVVALKMMDPRLSRDAKFLRRFRSEAKALAKLENPHIVMVYALRETELGFFIVMEYVDSMDLAVKIRNSGPMSPPEALPVFKQLLNALGHAHQAGVIHRDIKPRNVLISERGLVKVMDFGLAKIQQDSDTTATQSIIGTPYYMSPEQVKGLTNVTYLSDLYSLGMTFYEMLAGRTPFEKEEPDFALLEAIVKRKFPPPSEFNPEIPPALSKIIMQALEKDPENRYQSAGEMLAAIEQYEADQQQSGASTGAGVRPLRKASAGGSPGALPRKKKRRIFLPLLGLVLVLLLMLAALLPEIRQQFFTGPAERASPEGPSVPAETRQTVPEQFATHGSLNITSQPSKALVWIDGEQMGRTPYTAGELTAGTHNLRLEKEGYRSWEDNAVRIEARQSRSLHADLLPRAAPTAPVSKPVPTGKLVLQVLPRGAIYVDGERKSANTNEIIRIGLPEGSHTVRFQHPQYGSHETSVTIEKKRSRQLTCYFENFISVQSLDASEQPLWSTVVINGRDDEELTTPIAKYPLPPGQYTITVRRAGYRTVEGDKSIHVRPAFKEIIIPLVFHLQKEGIDGE